MHEFLFFSSLLEINDTNFGGNKTNDADRDLDVSYRNNNKIGTIEIFCSLDKMSNADG